MKQSRNERQHVRRIILPPTVGGSGLKLTALMKAQRGDYSPADSRRERIETSKVMVSRSTVSILPPTVGGSGLKLPGGDGRGDLGLILPPTVGGSGLKRDGNRGCGLRQGFSRRQSAGAD